ncbi:MAG: hypothetical protein WC965_12640 [Thiohalomonadaceae bacterium]
MAFLSILSKKMASFVLLAFVLTNIISCGGGGGGGGGESSSPSASLTDSLRGFNQATDDFTTDYLTLVDTLNWLNYLLHINNNEVSTDELINEAITWLAEDATELRRSVDAMDRAEASIQSYYTDQHPQGIAASTIIGAGLVVSGLYSFATWLQDKSNEATNKRNESSEELVRIGQGIPGAEKSYLQKRGEMRDIGLEVIQKTTTKVTTDMILTPINPASVGGVILKEAAGNLLEEGLRVISTTDSCQVSFEDPNCRIAISETSKSDPAMVVSGNTSIVVAGGDTSRITIPNQHVPPGSTQEIKREAIPINQATGNLIAANDDDKQQTLPPAVAPALSLSYTVASETQDSITYLVAAAVSGVSQPTNVKISVQNASVSGPTRTVTRDSTIVWNVIVLGKNAQITVTRQDTGQQQFLTLPGKSLGHDGTYSGTYSLTYKADGYICFGGSGDTSVTIKGNTLSGEDIVSGSVTPNTSGSATVVGTTIFGRTYNGTVHNGIISGSWADSNGHCAGTFHLVRD